jgi:6-phosphogluconolactonase
VVKKKSLIPKIVTHMKKLLLLTALTIPLTHAEPVFIGTGANGIYLADFNPETGTLSEPKLAVQYERPGFLALHPEKPILYSIGGNNTVAALTIGDNHSLTPINHTSCGGKGPCHLAVDATGKTLAVANYSDGSVVTISIKPDGSLGDLVSSIITPGSGPNQARQEQPHAHGVYFDKSNNFLFAPDLGTDKTLVFKHDPATSKITPHEPPALIAPPSSGPRHMTFSADEKHAYVINELNATITVAEYNKTDGTLKDIQTINTLPKDFTDPNTTAEIEVHPNGNFVYASNRGHDSIAVFQRDPKTGTLTFLQHTPCGGKHPRHFKIHPSGKWLLCGHMNSDTISILPLNPQTGLLSTPSQTIPSPKPICILFP